LSPWLCAVLMAGLAGCARQCLLPSQRPAVELRLFFGRGMPDGGAVGDAAWLDFSARVLTPAFPAGFTAYDATGQWRDPASGVVTRERSKVVEAVGPASPALVERVMAAYRVQFRQIAVGVVSREVCAAF
jgi:hypothetical protein